MLLSTSILLQVEEAQSSVCKDSPPQQLQYQCYTTLPCQGWRWKPPAPLRVPWPVCWCIRIHFTTVTSKTSKLELGAGGFCHVEQHSQNDSRDFIKPNQISYFCRELVCPFRWKMKTDTPDVHAHIAVQKRQFCTDMAFFHLGTESIFGNLLSLMQYYCRDPTKVEVSCHTGSWV